MLTRMLWSRRLRKASDDSSGQAVGKNFESRRSHVQAIDSRGAMFSWVSRITQIRLEAVENPIHRAKGLANAVDHGCDRDVQSHREPQPYTWPFWHI